MIVYLITGNCAKLMVQWYNVGMLQFHLKRRLMAPRYRLMAPPDLADYCTARTQVSDQYIDHAHCRRKGVALERRLIIAQP